MKKIKNKNAQKVGTILKCLHKSFVLSVIFSLFFTSACTSFRKGFSESSGAIWNLQSEPRPGTMAFRSKSEDRMNRAIDESEKVAQDAGKDGLVEDPWDIWYYLNLHQ